MKVVEKTMALEPGSPTPCGLEPRQIELVRLVHGVEVQGAHLPCWRIKISFLC